MKSNEDTLQSHQNEAETTQNLQEELLYTRTRVDGMFYRLTRYIIIDISLPLF
jgi:hypothetical protein